MRPLDVEITPRDNYNHVARLFPQIVDLRGRYEFTIGELSFKLVRRTTGQKAFASRAETFYPVVNWVIICITQDPPRETKFLRSRVCREFHHKKAEAIRCLNRRLSSRLGDWTDEPYIELINRLYNQK
jgi:hypothetical protein